MPKACTVKSAEDNYAVLLELWTTVLDGIIDPDVHARVRGVKQC